MYEYVKAEGIGMTKNEATASSNSAVECWKYAIKCYLEALDLKKDEFDFLMSWIDDVTEVEPKP